MDGVLIIDKPEGCTSHDVVAILRKVLNTRQIGHTGTLDPIATGVLPVLIGKATKISKYFVEHDKIYIATIKLGEKTDTGDGTGNIICRGSMVCCPGCMPCNPYNISEKNIQTVLQSFIGKQKQTPPMYSAIKINGKKLYEYAREGQAVELEPRDIEIYNIELKNYNNDEITFEVACSKGTYVRVLCENIAEELGTVGYMKDLRRISVDRFNIQNAVPLEDIKQNPNLAHKNIIKIEDVFKDNKEISLDDRNLELFLNGVMLTREENDGLFRVYNQNEFIGLGTIRNNLLKRDVIMC
ncbi:MAG: tRNA pseudouridine(55) synthase TruB [Firmicutes bacterium]|nr:tRNA pseudouridine(55) synthase TruB [Bacillota bacterium]